jgi:hypothetical protein
VTPVLAQACAPSCLRSHVMSLMPRRWWTEAVRRGPDHVLIYFTARVMVELTLTHGSTIIVVARNRVRKADEGRATNDAWSSACTSAATRQPGFANQRKNC